MGYPKIDLKNPVLKNGIHFVTADYKTRNPAYKTHNGIDFIGRNDKGEDYARDYIIAAADGVIDAAVSNYTKTLTRLTGTAEDRGNYVRIKHDTGLYTVYMHLAVGTVTVKTGESVKKGQVLGYMGNTGYSKGNHLHFAVGDGKAWLDPLPYINGEKELQRATVATAPSVCATAPKTTQTPAQTQGGDFKPGDKVHIITGSTDVNTKKRYSAFVYVKTYDVIAVDEKYLTFGIGKTVTGKTYIENCRKR